MSETIVVGVDGSAPSQAALRWAAEEATLRGARLVAVHAWSFVPPAPMAEPGMMPMPAIDYAGALEAEREAVEAELETILANAFPDGEPVPIERRLVEGGAGEAIEEAAREADLVVVGSRGRSGLTAALLGSVSQHVLHHVACPVVVVKGTSGN
ncbi:MAG: universal stress protein [Thermoleophilia bacterium]|nr:universal stress protein [Gaiellaceae bacterium]MDW8339054.1 universal stress protein [Thermoleophilia bacterium]